MLSGHLLLLLLALLLACTNAATSLSTTVTEGPEECDDSDKIKKGNYVQMHYVGSIDESSETGEKGKVFDSSDKRGRTFDFTVGKGQVIKVCVVCLYAVCDGLFTVFLTAYHTTIAGMGLWIAGIMQGCQGDIDHSSRSRIWKSGSWRRSHSWWCHTSI